MSFVIQVSNILKKKKGYLNVYFYIAKLNLIDE